MLINEVIGPHNDKELELMIQGTKPAALAFAREMSDWWPAIKKYGWTVDIVRHPELEASYVIARDPAKAAEIKTLLTNFYAGIKPLGSKNLYFAQLGRLLGYSATDIAHFILRINAYKLLSGTGAVLSGLGRFAAGAASMGASLATYTGDLNSGEDEELARLRAKYPTWASTQEPR
jgi:hypothetical protein